VFQVSCAPKLLHIFSFTPVGRRIVRARYRYSTNFILTQLDIKVTPLCSWQTPPVLLELLSRSHEAQFGAFVQFYRSRHLDINIPETPNLAPLPVSPEFSGSKIVPGLSKLDKRADL